MKFKLDENLSPTLAAGFLAAGHEAHSVLEQALGGASDPRVIEVCRLENRALITLDLDFANIQRYPPEHYAGIIMLCRSRYRPGNGRSTPSTRFRADAMLRPQVKRFRDWLSAQATGTREWLLQHVQSSEKGPLPTANSKAGRA